MANIFEHKDRRVIPNWRSFGRTIILGELNSFQKERLQKIEEVSIDDYIIDFELNKTNIHASELLSAAIVNNKREHKSAVKAAQFILGNANNTTQSQISLANQILKGKSEKDITERFKEIDIISLSKIVDPKPFYEKIHETKKLLRIYPLNAILYVELSRYYSILGQEIGSVQAMKTALHLAPNNRFILRSATRLFAHFNTEQNDYINHIHYILKNNPMTISDPWLISAEISISTIKGQNSILIKKGVELINSGNISSYNFTELASSIATVEMLNGNIKKSRKFFNKSLINPNDNSLAQIEWASIKDSQLETMQASYKVKMNFEALALSNFHNNEYKLALDNVAKWFTDQPYSKRPIMFGSNLASMIMKDQEKSITLLKAGLISHPNDPQLINNLAYSLALQNKPNDALIQLNKIKYDSEIDQTTKICLSATKGLALFRSGFVNEGRRLYIDAIEQTKQINNQNFNWIAILNYAREEILQKSKYVKPLMNIVEQIPKNIKDIAIKTLREDIVSLYKQLNSSLEK